jgi:hypothetical protein
LGRHVAHNREVLGGWQLVTTRPKSKHAEHAAIILQDIVFLSCDVSFVPFINVSHELGLHRSQRRRGVMVALICFSTKLGTMA